MDDMYTSSHWEHMILGVPTDLSAFGLVVYCWPNPNPLSSDNAIYSVQE